MYLHFVSNETKAFFVLNNVACTTYAAILVVRIDRCIDASQSIIISLWSGGSIV